jgi:hypothetical protein
MKHTCLPHDFRFDLFLRICSKFALIPVNTAIKRAKNNSRLLLALITEQCSDEREARTDRNLKEVCLVMHETRADSVIEPWTDAFRRQRKMNNGRKYHRRARLFYEHAAKKPSDRRHVRKHFHLSIQITLRKLNVSPYEKAGKYMLMHTQDLI